MGASSKILTVQVILLIATTAVMIFGVVKRQEDTKVAPLSGTNASACYHREQGSSGCETSFARLTSSPLSAEGKPIRLVGYLAIRNGVPLLFPNEHDYVHDVIVNAIAIQGSIQDLTVLDGRWYSYVRAQGLFRLSTSSGAEPWFGQIQPPLKVVAVEAVKREDPSDLRISGGFTGE